MKVLIRTLISILVVFASMFVITAAIDFTGPGERPLAPITQEDQDTAAKQPSLRREGVRAPEGPAYTAAGAAFQLHRYGKRPSWRIKTIHA